MVETSASCTPHWEDLQGSVLVEAAEGQEEWVLVLDPEGAPVEVRMPWPSTNSCLSFCAQEDHPQLDKGTKEPWAAQEVLTQWGNTWRT